MKTDREFLDGVYEKASHAQEEMDDLDLAPLPENKPKRAFLVMLGTTTAAAVALVCIPVLLFGSNQASPSVAHTPEPAAFSVSEAPGEPKQARSDPVDLLLNQAEAAVKVEATGDPQEPFRLAKVWKAPAGWELGQAPVSMERAMDGCPAALLFFGRWEGEQVLLDAYRQTDPANPQRYENVDGQWIEESDLG